MTIQLRVTPSKEWAVVTFWNGKQQIAKCIGVRYSPKDKKYMTFRLADDGSGDRPLIEFTLNELQTFIVGRLMMNSFEFIELS